MIYLYLFILGSDFDYYINIDIIGVEKEVEFIFVFKVRFGLYNVMFNLVWIAVLDSVVGRVFD